MRVLVLHGTKGSPEGNWFPWLKQELTVLGIVVDVPQMPTPQNQTPEDWYTTLAVSNLLPDKNTVIVGHSLGGNYALGLAEIVPVHGLVLVSPVLSDGSLEEYNVLNKPFVQDGFDWNAIKENASHIHILVGDNDPYLPLAPTLEAAKILGVEAEIISGGGHLNAEFGYLELPSVLKVLKDMLHG